MGGIAGPSGLLGAAVTCALMAVGSPAAADDSVTVHGTAFPTAAAQLSLVGCADLYQRSDEELHPYLSLGRSPAGERSLGYDLAGGNAVGSLHLVDSMASTSVASLDVKAPDGSTGVAYAGYQEPLDAGTDLVWFGRAELAAGPGGWTTYDASQLIYTWTKYDMATQQVVPESLHVPAGAVTTVADFMASRGGDGPGLYTIGFGCDGGPFTMDAMRVGPAGAVTTFDLEGLKTATSMGGSGVSITAGERVKLSGEVRTSTGTRVPHATVVLEERPWNSDAWRRVDVVAADPHDASEVVAPTSSTTYRWRFVDRPVAEGSVSGTYDVSVAPLIEAAPHGDPVGSVTGRTFPAKPGAVATLREVGGTGEPVGQAVVANDGTFSIHVPPGTSGRFVVTTAGGDGHLPGLSDRFTIDVPEAVAPPPSTSSAPSAPSEPTDPPSSAAASESTEESSPTAAATSASASAEPSAEPSEATEEPTALETAAATLTP